MTVLKIDLPGGVWGNAFCILWRDRLSFATCDHLFLGIGSITTLDITFSDGVNSCSAACDLYRHPTADVAIVIPRAVLRFPCTPIKILRTTQERVIGTQNVVVKGFAPTPANPPTPASPPSLTTLHGATRDQYSGSKTCIHAAGNRTYSGELIPNSLRGIHGLSGSPILTIDLKGAIAVYSCSSGSVMLTDGFHCGHFEEIP